MPTDYEGSYAASSVTTNGNEHTVWLPHLFSGVTAYWQFAPDDGVLTVGEDNETAHLTGTIQNNNVAEYTLEVDAHFELTDPNEPGYGGGKKGGIKDGLTTDVIDTWSFFNLTSATLMGTQGSILEGLTLTLTQLPEDGKYPFQLGDGANDKNAGLGASAWFKWEVSTSQFYDGPTAFDTRDGGHGDFNLNLEMQAVPLPAAGWMLIAGVAGLGAMRRRKRPA